MAGLRENYVERPKEGWTCIRRKGKRRTTLIIDSFTVAWKRKLKTKLTADVIGHVPREISRVVFFYITHGGKLVGNIYSPQYFRSPIATRGLEILIDCDFKIEASKLKRLEHLKEIIERNYEPVVERERGEVERGRK